MFNALQFDLHNGGRVRAPTYRLVGRRRTSSQFTAVLDPITGRPDTQIEVVIASFRLIEIATGKDVVNGQLPRARRLRHSRLRSSVSPANARSATPKTGRSWLPPRPSGIAWRRISSPALNSGMCFTSQVPLLRDAEVRRIVAVKSADVDASCPPQSGAAGGPRLRRGLPVLSASGSGAGQRVGRRPGRSVFAGAARRRRNRRRSRPFAG